jgi:hypothetical protein
LNHTISWYPAGECLIDEETGDTLVQLQGITIVTVSPSGEVVLSTGGWYTPDTIAGMNKALKPIGMKVSQGIEELKHKYFKHLACRLRL